MGKNNYLLISSSSNLINKKIAEIIKDKKLEEATITKYDLEEVSLNDLQEDLDTISFLTPHKVVIGYNASFLGREAKEKEEDIKHFLKYLDQEIEGVLCILTTDKLDERKKVVKEIKKKINLFNLEGNIKEIIKKELEPLTITDSDLTYLIECSNNNFDQLIEEATKLKLYLNDKKEITKKDILELVSPPKQDKEQLTFDLVRYISLKDKRNALNTLNILSSEDSDIMSFLGLLESQYRLIYQVKILENEGLKQEEIATKLSIHPYRILKTMELTRYYTKEQIGKVITSLANLDYEIKSGKRENSVALEMFILDKIEN